MAPTPLAPNSTITTLHTAFTTIDLAAPPQSGDNSNQLVGVIIGAISAGVALVLMHRCIGNLSGTPDQEKRPEALQCVCCYSTT